MDHRPAKRTTQCVNQFQTVFLSELILHNTVPGAFENANSWAENNHTIPFPYNPSPATTWIRVPLFDITITNVAIGPLYIVGNSGLTVSATDPNWPGLFSPPPEPVPPQLP
jgi:hypothetical protein